MLYQTMLSAIDPKDGELKTWIGPRIEAMCRAEAEEKIKEFGYLRITGILLEELDSKTDKTKTLFNMN